MAYPPKPTDGGGNVDVPIEVEFVPEGEEPINFVHRDLHTGNVMFGDLDPNEDEHKICPTVKVSLR